MRYVWAVLLVSVLAGCTSMELAQWTSGMNQAAGGGNCTYDDSYGDELVSLDIQYQDGRHAGTITVTGSLICDYMFLDISSSVPRDMSCDISVGDVGDRVLVPASGYVDDYELGKSYSSNSNTEIRCSPAG